MLRLSLRAGRGSVGPAVWVAAWALGVQASEVRGQTQILETHTSTLTTYLGGATGVQGVTPLATQRGVGLDGSLRGGSGPAWALAGNPFGDGVGAGQARIGDMVLATGAYGPFDVDWSGPAPGASRWVNLKWSGSYYIASYQYLGAGMLVGTTLDEPNVFTNLYAAGSPNGYGNLDRFNRVTTSNWTNGVTGGTDFYHVDLSYDNLGNIMTATDTIHADTAGKHRFDVDYSLDKLSRLTRADEGHLSGGSVSPRTRDERWLDGSGNLALSQTGNWSRRRLDLNGDGDFVDTSELDDTGTFNNANEWLTRDTDSNSSVNHTLTHDAVGNMTDDGKSYKYTYDAFGRLVTVKNQSNATVAEYKYNGLGHRTGWHFDADLDSDVDGSDPWVYFQYDERWRVVATWRGSDLFAKEQYVYHAAGARGLGGSSYIDSVILRDRDPTGWTISTADETSERRYYCQNWRADVSVILPSTGCDGGSGPGILEWVKYSAYGVPQAFSMADYNRDGAANSSDFNGTTGDYDIDFSNGDPRADVNFDGGVSIDDLLLIANAASEAAPRGTQSCASTKNRIGYAGYQWDLVVGVNHVRHRVYLPEMGRWTRRDPLGYVDGMGLYKYVAGTPLVSIDSRGTDSVKAVLEDHRVEDWIIYGGGSNLTPEEREFCLWNPLDCSHINHVRKRLVDGWLKPRWAWHWWEGPGTSSVHNAVLHCALACSLRNTSDADDDMRRWLELHETATPGWDCETNMDLDNNDTGWKQVVPCPNGCTDPWDVERVINLCINRCEMLARANQLVWLNPPPPRPPNTAPDGLPDQLKNCPPGTRSRVGGCCGTVWV